MGTETKLLNMFMLSETRPRMREEIISRERYLDFFEEQFGEDRILCVDGPEGVGVTTTLALFAKRHGDDCASYFNNGWSRHLLNPHIIAQSLLAQLSLFTGLTLNPEEKETSLAQCIFRLNKASKNKLLYFVFDGFYSLPTEYVDGIKTLLLPLFGLENVRFLFAGTEESIRQLLPEGVHAKETNKILRFQRNDVEDYLNRVFPELNKEIIETVYDLSDHGLARRISILIEKLKKDGIQKIRDYYTYNVTDFYEEDYDWIEAQDDRNLYLMMSLLTFSERPLNKNSIMHTLKLEDEVMSALMEKSKDYVEEENGLINLRSDDFRKYLRDKLLKYKTDIELLMIDQIERSGGEAEKFVYLPALYKHVKDNKQLVNYLTSENVQRYLVDNKSQAALNEQCEYGFNACTDFETQAGASFRFAINRSVSREIEKNELSDTEIEALIAIGDEEQAFDLTQHVFLLEEKLKSLLIIAQAGKNLSGAMREQIDMQIDMLTRTIRFEHIPDKALELAKLMLPVNIEKALEIIDKVAKVTKDRQQIDRLYAAFSLSYFNEGKNDENDTTKTDIANTRIVDEGLRMMTSVMKSIMNDRTAAQVVAKMKELPTPSGQLYFLRFWIPEHSKWEDIGDAVEYAVKLVIDTSATTMPKVTFLRMFCKPLPNMNELQVRKVVGLLDAVTVNIKFPTVEYVRLMILVIRAVVKYDKKEAENRLQALYLEILELKDKALQAHCKALLLRDYEKLGEKNDVENWLAPSFKLQNEIFDDVLEELQSSAYHLKVVEGPIKVLVCDYPSFVKDVIARMNTAERQTRAYLLAATEYIRQTDVKKINWKYFLTLFENITYDKTDRDKPLLELLHKIIDVNDKDTILLQTVKDNYLLFMEVERADELCYFLASLYVWLCNNYIDEIFNDGSSVEAFKKKVKDDLDRAWNTIRVPWLKVNTGYQIGKVLSKISLKQEARDYVSKTAEVRKNQMLSSLSCVEAYGESLNLYSHSLGILIRSGLSRDEDFEQFSKLMDYDGSEGEAIIEWSRIALECYGVNDIERFNKIMNRYVTKSLKDFSIYQQKSVLYNISPALYMSLPTLLYGRLEEYDTNFMNACIENVARYILTKYPYPEHTSTNSIEPQIPLEKKDYELILDLMEHTQDDGFIFNYTDVLTRSIKNNRGNKLSREMQRVLLDTLQDIVNRRLPMYGGIQHEGYKIACTAMIEDSKAGGNVDAATLKQRIEGVNNRADQALLYSLVARNLKRSSEKAEFIDIALEKAEGINFTFDRMNRFSMCVQETILTSSHLKAQSVGKKVMELMNKDRNGSYQDYQRMLDIVRDNDEELADTMLEMVDDDPARVQYKSMLKQRAQSSKKIEAAKNDFKQLQKLNYDEQVRFFDKQMEVLVKKKNVPRNLSDTHPVISIIYHNPITDTQNAVLYFMENVCQKNALNGKYKFLIREMHNAIADNIKIILAIASGTKDKLDRVIRIVNEKIDANDAIIQVGQKDKGVRRLLDWYKSNPKDVLRIIDPYFHAEDLYVIKMMMDINNDLNCLILTWNGTKEPLLDLYQKGWHMVSEELTGRIEVKSCCYEDRPDKCPFHDRWWLLNDTDEDKAIGVRMSSVGTLGNRITEISDMDDQAVESTMSVFNRFFVYMAPKYDGLKVKYEEAKVR